VGFGAGNGGRGVCTAGLFRAALAVVPVHKIMKTVARERLGVVGDAALTDAAPGELPSVTLRLRCGPMGD